MQKYSEQKKYLKCQVGTDPYEAMHAGLILSQLTLSSLSSQKDRQNDTFWSKYGTNSVLRLHCHTCKIFKFVAYVDQMAYQTVKTCPLMILVFKDSSWKHNCMIHGYLVVNRIYTESELAIYKHCFNWTCRHIHRHMYHGTSSLDRPLLKTFTHNKWTRICGKRDNTRFTK